MRARRERSRSSRTAQRWPSEKEATKILSEPEVTAIADVKMGTEKATAWGCDLTHGYIDINADYRS